MSLEVNATHKGAPLLWLLSARRVQTAFTSPVRVTLTACRIVGQHNTPLVPMHLLLGHATIPNGMSQCHLRDLHDQPNTTESCCVLRVLHRPNNEVSHRDKRESFLPHLTATCISRTKCLRTYAVQHFRLNWTRSHVMDSLCANMLAVSSVF